MTLNIIKTLILYFLSLEYCFCCKNCNNNNNNNNNNNKINNNQNLNNNQQDKEEEEEEEDNDNNDKNVEIIKNDDVYVKKFTNRVNGEIAEKLYIFSNTFKGKNEEEKFFKEDDPKLKNDYFKNNYLNLSKIGGNIVYVLFDKKTDDIICLLAIEDLGNGKITINNIDVYPQKTIYFSIFQCHYKYRNKGYGKILMLYVLQQFKKGTGFLLAVNGDREVMTNKKLSEVYKKFGFQLSFYNELDKYDENNDQNYCPHMAFIKNDNKTYYKNKPVKITIEER